MRHTRVTSQNTNLSQLKYELHNILQKIEQLNNDDKIKALSYVQSLIKVKSNGCQEKYNEKNISRSSKGGRRNITIFKKRFKCTLCEETNETKLGLLKHMEACHINTPISCMKCRHTLNSRAAYEWHTTQLCKKKCRFRSQMFGCLECLKNHDGYKCATCCKIFASKKGVEEHKELGHTVHGMDQKFCCLHCPQSFMRKSLLCKHLQIHQDKRTIDKEQYLKHCRTETHQKSKSIITNGLCAHCGIVFTQEHRLTNHLPQHHGNQLQTFYCSNCKFQTQFKANLERHKNLHFIEKDTFICEYCGKNLSTFAVLMDHIKYNHLEKKIFKCEECSFSFKRKFELVRHNATHSSERPHVCKICKRAFKRLNHLHRHETTVHSVISETRTVKRLKNSNDEILPVVNSSTKQPITNNPSANAIDRIDHSATDYTPTYILNPPTKDSCLLNGEVFWGYNNMENKAIRPDISCISANVNILSVHYLQSATNAETSSGSI